MSSFAERLRGYAAAIPFAVLLFVLWPLIGLTKALAGATVAVVFSVLLEQNWKRRHDKTFLTSIAVLGVVHVLAIWLIPFSRPSTGLVAVPIAFVDYFLLARLLGWIEKRFGDG